MGQGLPRSAHGPQCRECFGWAKILPRPQATRAPSISPTQNLAWDSWGSCAPGSRPRSSEGVPGDPFFHYQPVGSIQFWGYTCLNEKLILKKLLQPWPNGSACWSFIPTHQGCGSVTGLFSRSLVPWSLVPGRQGTWGNQPMNAQMDGAVNMSPSVSVSQIN